MKGRILRFGQFYPRGVAKLIIYLVRLGIGHGPIKKLYAKILSLVNKKKPLDILYHGVRFRLFPHNNTIESKMLVSSRLRETEELFILQAYLNTDSIFVDIGANIGYYSLMVTKNTGSKVLAFEPNPEVFNRFKTNIELNDFTKTIKLFPIGIGDAEKEIELRLSTQDMGSSSLVNKNLSGQTIKIKMMKLHTVLKKERVARIDVLKIDIEGFEDKALFPYFKSIKKINYPKLIVMEDSSQKDWDENILGWLVTKHYDILLRTRGNILLTLKKFS